MYKVDNYEFGLINVSGESYSRDLIILPDTIITDWWRLKGHELCREDLVHLLKRPIQLLIIGTGYNGRMKVPDELTEELESFGIDVIVKDSRNAVELYNQLVNQRQDLALALHLTC
ncbi:MAG: Mth938-like domain-containing protein [Candidatus Thorarchaeota archaeon]